MRDVREEEKPCTESPSLRKNYVPSNAEISAMEIRLWEIWRKNRIQT